MDGLAAAAAETGADSMDALGEGAHREAEDGCEASRMEVEAKRVVAIVISDPVYEGEDDEVEGETGAHMEAIEPRRGGSATGPFLLPALASSWFSWRAGAADCWRWRCC